MWTLVIPQAFHTGVSTMGRGGFGDLTPLDILGCMQVQYGVPSAQEEEDAFIGRQDRCRDWMAGGRTNLPDPIGSDPKVRV